MNQYLRYEADSKTLAAIGTHVGNHVTVRLPRAVAEAAVAAWERDERDEPGEETREQHALRDQAAELALIGLAITERGRWQDDAVHVDLPLAAACAAARAAR